MYSPLIIVILVFITLVKSDELLMRNSEFLKSNYNYAQSKPQSKRPHMIIILADDMGWNDVSFHGSNQIPTPNIDALAYNGVILNNHYVSALCTPSRASLMTGKYPIHLGMQHSVISEAEPRGLPLREKLLPEYLKDAGYKTYAIGKWHLGFFKKEYTPTFRGFDSHFGYWNGLQDYYNHNVQATKEKWIGFDMRRNMSVAWDTVQKYSTDLFTEEAVRLIEVHDANNPMFMYLSHLAVHSGTDNDPLQAPDEEIAKFSYIRNTERRIYAAMVSKLDQSVGDVVTALRKKEMLQNSIIIFISDNGAPTIGIYSNRGSNYPLRGIKESPWEGGVRGIAAVWSPLIEKSKRVSDQLMSIVDWLPTLCSVAGLNTDVLGVIDGINMWPNLVRGGINSRTEILINIDEIDNYASIRSGDFKYVIGSNDNNTGWYGESGRSENKDVEGISPEYLPQHVLMSKVGIAISGMITTQQVTDLRKKNKTSIKSVESVAQILTEQEILQLRMKAELKCNVKKKEKINCNPFQAPCVFNIKEDPCEMVNIAKVRPKVRRMLERALFKYRLSMLPASNLMSDPLANPAYWNNTWVNWRSENPLDIENLRFANEFKLPGYAISALISGFSIRAICYVIAMKKYLK